MKTRIEQMDDIMEALYKLMSETKSYEKKLRIQNVIDKVIELTFSD